MKIKKLLLFSLMCNLMFTFLNILYIVSGSISEKMVGVLSIISICLYAVRSYKFGKSRKDLYISYICLIINTLASGALIVKQYPSNLYLCTGLIIIFWGFLIYTLFKVR